MQGLKKYLIGLGAFRLFLAWMVIACHTTGYYEFTDFDAGTVAVSAFFFISGYLMPLTFEKNYLKFGWLTGSKIFFLNRAIRIYPIYLATIVLIIFQSAFNSLIHQSWEGVFKSPFIPIESWLQNILLVGLNQSIFWGSYFRFNNPAWTLDIELQYYLVVPLFIFLYKRYKILAITLLSFVSLIGFWIYFHPFDLVDIDRSFLAWSFFFIGGFFFQKAKLTMSNNLKIVLAFGITLVMLSMLPYVESVAGLKTLIFSIVFVLISFPLLMVQKNYQYHSFDKILGDLSYPTYIVHILILSYSAKIVTYLGGSSLNSDILFFYTLAINIILTTIISFLALRFIADPIDSLRNRIRGNVS